MTTKLIVTILSLIFSVYLLIKSFTPSNRPRDHAREYAPPNKKREKHCWITFKKPNAVGITIIILLIFIAFYKLHDFTPIEALQKIQEKAQQTQKQLKQQVLFLVFGNNNRITLEKFHKGELKAVRLPVNQPNEINYFTRKQVFDQRKFYVSQSRFATPDYDPSKNPAFMQIVDGKPWIGLDSEGYATEEFLTSTDFPIINGVSEETRFINNPDILVGIAFGGGINCASEYDKVAFHTIPKALYYSPEEKTFIVEYNLSEYFQKAYCRDTAYSKYRFILSGINARDFGYNNALVDNIFNITFLEAENITNTITQFKDLIHLGQNCRVPGGCNNHSPFQGNLVFHFDTDPGDKQTFMTMKLWENPPKNAMRKADSNLIMIFK